MNWESIRFDPFPNWPTWIVAASLVGLLLAWLAWWNSSRLGALRNGGLMTLRMLAVGVLLLMLLRPQRREDLPIEKRETLVIAGIDTSESMDQMDEGNRKRVDVAVRLLADAKLDESQIQLRTMTFDEDARAISQETLPTLKATGSDTRFHTSIQTMLGQAKKSAKADQSLILFTDGHDFEMTSPARTALAARAKNVAIYAVPLGAIGQVRDIAVRLAGYQPYCYLKQKSKITAIARLSGCENEFITAQLYRNGKLADSKTVPTREDVEVPVEFTVSEAESGQVEYEVRVLPLYREAEMTNNSAITYLNVLDDKLRLLLIEGSPYWDTTFLQRTLMRNDKMDLDALIQIEPRKLRRLRKTEGADALELPATRADFEAYDVVLLGANVGDVLDEKAQAALVDYVREAGGSVICVRGPTGLSETVAAIIEPVTWEQVTPQEGELQVARDGRASGPLGLLGSYSRDGQRLPSLTTPFVVKERRDLSAVLAETRAAGAEKAMPALVHRPLGRGQVLALGAGDLWRWAFASEPAAREAVFDRTWDQLIVWLMAGGDRVPGARLRLRTSTANLPLGESIHFRLQLKQGTQASAPPMIEVKSGDQLLERITMEAGSDAMHYEASFVPGRAGRYQALVKLADGQTETARFMVFQENHERTEVAADRGYLKKLCEASGGQLVEPGHFGKFIETLKTSLQPADHRFRDVPLWDNPWLLGLIVTALAMEWYLRRRWGLS